MLVHFLDISFELLDHLRKSSSTHLFVCQTRRRLNLQLTLNQSVSRRPGGHRQAVGEHQTGKGCNVQVAFQLPSALLQVRPNQKSYYASSIYDMAIRIYGSQGKMLNDEKNCLKKLLEQLQCEKFLHGHKSPPCKKQVGVASLSRLHLDQD